LTEGPVRVYRPTHQRARRARCCSFNLSEALYSAGDRAIDALLAAALQTISRFEWFGGVEHGRDDPAPPEQARAQEAQRALPLLAVAGRVLAPGLARACRSSSAARTTIRTWLSSM